MNPPLMLLLSLALAVSPDAPSPSSMPASMPDSPAATPDSVFPATAARVYAIVPEQSEAGFDLKTTWHTVHGKSHSIRGEIRLPNGLTTRGAAVRLSLDAASLDSGNGKRDGDMREKFLEVAQYPTLEFQGDVATGDIKTDASSQLTLRGSFTAHGVSVPMEVQVECRFEGDLATCDTHFPLTLSGFAIRDPSKFFAKASDDLTAHAHLVGRRLIPPASASPAP